MNFLFVTRCMAVMNKTQVGGGVRSTLLIEALSRLGHVDVISFVKEPIESTIQNCDVIYCGETPKRERTLGDRIRLNLRLFFTPWHPEAYFVVNKEQAKIVSRYYNARHYDFVACHFLYDAIQCGLDKYANKLIVDVDDNMVSLEKRFLSNHPRRPLISWAMAYRKTLTIGMMQRRLLQRVRLSFYSNPDDPPYEKSVFLQNIPILSSPCREVTDITPMRLLFVGNIDYLPNKKGILHFVESIFPIIKERIPSVELDVVGLCEDRDTRSKLCSVNGVNVRGFVDCLEEEYENCRAVIVPIYQGTGTSIKFIEAVMMNRPIVSTPTGARGFDSLFKAGQHYWLAENDHVFADQVVAVLLSIEKANIMAHNAYEIGITHFSRKSFMDVVKVAVESLPDNQSL